MDLLFLLKLSAFPNITYHTSIAKRRVLKMPLAAVRVGLPRSGVSEVEYNQGVNYHHFQRLLNTFHLEKTTKRLSMTKQQLKSVLSIAQSVREREIIRYTAVVSSGLSATGARKHFGLGAMQQRTEKVEHALQEIQDIRLAFESVASVQESATLAQFGITLDHESDESYLGSSESEADDTLEPPDSHTESSISMQSILDIRRESNWNWFHVISTAEVKGISVSLVEFNIVSDLTEPELSLLRQSHEAFLETDRTDDAVQKREAAAINGDVVSESESDNPDDYIGNDQKKALLKKKIRAILLKCRRDRMKLVAETHFLERKAAKKVHGILAQYPP